MKPVKQLIWTTLVVFGLHGAAVAAVVNPGAVVNLSGTTAAANPNLAGVVQNDNLIAYSIAPFNPFQTIGGNVQNRVAESTNLGSLVFAPRIRDTFNIASTSAEIFAFVLDGYAGWHTDIDYRTDGLGDKAPDSVSRSVDGDQLTFRYSDPIQVDGILPGVQEESLFPSILTDATQYSLDGTMTIYMMLNGNPNDVRSVTVRGLAVPSAVPLPAPLALLASALGLLGLRRRGGASA